MQLPDRLPNDLEAERAVLGALLLDPGALVDVVECVDAEEFYDQAHREVFDACLQLNERGEPCDLLTVTNELRGRAHLKRAGGASYLSSLMDSLPDIANAHHYAAIVREKARLRQLIEVCHRAAAQATTEGITSDTISAGLVSELSRMDGERTTDQAWMSEVMAQQAQKVLELNAQGGGHFGHLIGVPSLDELTLGVKNEYYVLSGRPRTGKSTLADQWAINAAKETGRPALVCITEMSIQQRANRQLSAALGIPLPHLHNGTLTKYQRRSLELFVPGSEQVRMIHVAGRTAAEVRMMATRFAAQHGPPSIVVVDYLQELAGARGLYNSHEREGEKSSQMKILCQKLGVPVLALSQLNRESEKDNKPPQLSNLAGSSVIENEAYWIGMMHAPKQDDPASIVTYVRKHKDGPMGAAGMRLDTDHMRFVSAVRSEG